MDKHWTNVSTCQTDMEMEEKDFLIPVFLLNAACGWQQHVVNRECALRVLIVNLLLGIMYCLIVSSWSFGLSFSLFFFFFKREWFCFSCTLVVMGHSWIRATGLPWNASVLVWCIYLYIAWVLLKKTQQPCTLT